MPSCSSASLRRLCFWAIFVTLMLPVEVRIYPTYKVVADLHMLDTYAGLILPLIASATGTLLFRQFFMTVPDELLEASKIDGAGPWRFLVDTAIQFRMVSEGGCREDANLSFDPRPTGPRLDDRGEGGWMD